MMAQESYPFGGVNLPATVYVDAAHGWTYSENEDPGAFSVGATNGDTNLGFTVNSVAALTPGARVHLEIDRDGTTCGDNDLNAIVRDIAVSSTGQLDRLAVVYAEPCFGSTTRGFLSGEVAYNEPATTPVRSAPAEMFFPPTGSQSATATYPILMTAGTASSQTIASLRVQGADAQYFSLSADTCSGTTVTASSDCSVDVTYRPHASEDTADVVALDSAGRVIDTTPLDAALLPGTSYWAVSDPHGDNRVQVTEASDVPIGVSVGAETSSGGGYYQDSISMEGQDGSPYGDIEMGSDRPLNPGTYPIGGSSPLYFDYSSGSLDYRPLTGFVRISSVTPVIPDRGLRPLQGLAFTFVIRVAGSLTPIFGSIGANTATPVQVPGDTATQRYGDFVGNGSTDVAVFRPSTGRWYVRGAAPVKWGVTGDIPVPGDYDGNGTTDIAVFRPSTGRWYVRGAAPVEWGVTGDIPVPGDYDGNGTTDIAVFRPSTGRWYVRGAAPVEWGVTGDIPVPGDYDGNGITDIAVFRPSTGRWYVRGAAPVKWGVTGDIPVPGDYDGNGTTDIAVFRPANGTWYELGLGSIQYGQREDLPVAGAYGTDYRADPGIFRPGDGTWFLDGPYGQKIIRYGAPGDIPV